MKVNRKNQKAANTLGGENIIKTNNNRIKTIIICIVAGIVLLSGCIAVFTYRYYHQYDKVVFESTFRNSNLKKWWLKSQSTDSVKKQYNQTRSLAKSLLLNKFYSGHTVYLTADKKPFIISGTSALYLVQNGSTWDLGAKDKAALRTEYDEQKLAVGTKADYGAVNSRIQKLNSYKAVKGKNALAVDGQLRKDNIKIDKDGKENTLLCVSDVLPALNVKYSVKNNIMYCNFTDSFGASHGFKITIAKLAYQPWVYNNNKFPSISKKKNKYFIAQQILSQVFGFKVDYDESKGLVNITTDDADIEKPVVAAPVAMDISKAIDISLAQTLGILNDKGLLSDNAQATYDAYVAQQAAAQQAAAQQAAAQQAAAQQAAAQRASAQQAKNKTSSSKSSSSGSGSGSNSVPGFGHRIDLKNGVILTIIKGPFVNFYNGLGGFYDCYFNISISVANSSNQPFQLKASSFKLTTNNNSQIAINLPSDSTSVPPNSTSEVDGIVGCDGQNPPATITVTYTFDNGVTGSVTLQRDGL